MAKWRKSAESVSISRIKSEKATAINTQTNNIEPPKQTRWLRGSQLSPSYLKKKFSFSKSDETLSLVVVSFSKCLRSKIRDHNVLSKKDVEGLCEIDDIVASPEVVYASRISPRCGG